MSDTFESIHKRPFDDMSGIVIVDSLASMIANWKSAERLTVLPSPLSPETTRYLAHPDVEANMRGLHDVHANIKFVGNNVWLYPVDSKVFGTPTIPSEITVQQLLNPNDIDDGKAFVESVERLVHLGRDVLGPEDLDMHLRTLASGQYIHVDPDTVVCRNWGKETSELIDAQGLYDLNPSSNLWPRDLGVKAPSYARSLERGDICIFRKIWHRGPLRPQKPYRGGPWIGIHAERMQGFE